MKNVLNLLIILLLFSSCEANNQTLEKEPEEPIDNRTKFAQMSLNSSGAIDAHWESPSVYVLSFKQDSLEGKTKYGIDKETGKAVYEERALIIARGHALLGENLTGDPICVRVVYENGQELAYECSGENSDS